MPRLEDHWYSLHGNRLKNLQPTEKIGVEVWPSVSTTYVYVSLSFVSRLIPNPGDTTVAGRSFTVLN